MLKTPKSVCTMYALTYKTDMICPIVDKNIIPNTLWDQGLANPIIEGKYCAVKMSGISNRYPEFLWREEGLVCSCGFSLHMSSACFGSPDKNDILRHIVINTV